MAEILSLVQDHVEKTSSAVPDAAYTEHLFKTNQARIFLNCMKLSSLYRSRFLKY